MKTKYLVKFLNREAHLEADLELIDVMSIASNEGLISSDINKLFDTIDHQKHTRLAKRTVSNYSREIAFSNLKTTFYAAYIKEIYENVASYCTELIAGAARNGLSPERIIGQHKLSIQAKDLLRLEDMNAVIDLIAASLFRDIEAERSTIKTLKSVASKLDLDVDDDIMKKALTYLDIRHVLVHSEGIADKEFCEKHPHFSVTVGEKIGLNYNLILDARQSITEMVKNYDASVTNKGIVSTDDLQP